MIDTTTSKEPLVSVIVRTVDRPVYLKECLQSIARQEYRNIEIVLVNDAGPPLDEFLSELRLPFPLKYKRFDYNVGRSASGNHGLDISSGKYLCFLDDDDIFYPNHIGILVEALESSEFKVAYTDAVRATQIVAPFDKRRYKTCDTALVYSEQLELKKFICEDGNHLPILSALFEKKCLESGIRFDVDMEVLEDWDFWIQLAKENEFHHIQEITAEYRVRLDGTNTVGQLNHIWDWSRNRIKDKYSDLRKSLGVNWN